MEAMKQPQYATQSVAQMTLVLYAVDKGFMDTVPVEKVVEYEQALLEYLDVHQSALLEKMNKAPVYSDELAKEMTQVLEAFNRTQGF